MITGSICFFRSFSSGGSRLPVSSIVNSCTAFVVAAACASLSVVNKPSAASKSSICFLTAFILSRLTSTPAFFSSSSFSKTCCGVSRFSPIKSLISFARPLLTSSSNFPSCSPPLVSALTIFSLLMFDSAAASTCFFRPSNPPSCWASALFSINARN